MSVPHLVFQATHTAGLSTGEAITQNTFLVLLVLLPITLLILNRTANPKPESRARRDARRLSR
ncbi:MAG: hypothetical protein M3381_10135 [Actinomycetota bacterium]|nr:hypothetical protein [Actinomycetota bacterium]